MTIATAAASRAFAEQVEFSIQRETVMGQSVYVTSDLPAMGAGAPQRAVKLSPNAYPLWSAVFDLPKGISIRPVYYLRNDAPEQAGDSSNGSIISTGAEITTSPASFAAPIHRIIAADTVQAASARITSEAPGFPPIEIPLFSAPYASGMRVWTAQIPVEHVAMGRMIQFFLDGKPLPANGPVRLHGASVWWRHDQGFLSDPPETAPSAARRDLFSWTPSNPVFQARLIRVLLPRNYDNEPARHYPVLYAQDGQNLYAPGGTYGSWDLDQVVPNLIARGEMAEFIIVGIDNTSDRALEYTPEYAKGIAGDRRGHAYLEIVRDELMPIINQRYRTLTGPEYTSHLGSSLGGILGFEAAYEFRGTFGAVIAMSPAFWVGQEEFLARARRSPDSHARVWIDSGTEGIGGNDGYWNTFQIRDAMMEVGNALGGPLQHALGLNQSHNEAAWKLRSPDALRWLYSPALAPAQPIGGNAWILTGDGPEPRPVH